MKENESKEEKNSNAKTSSAAPRIESRPLDMDKPFTHPFT